MSTPDLPHRLLTALGQAGAATSDGDLDAPGLALSAGAGGRVWRPAAVLVAFCADGRGGWNLLLTKRASGLKHHPGQIALPGGKIDAGDASPAATALREAQEEIGLPPAQVQVLGVMPDHLTVTGYRVTPVLALVTAPFAPVAERGEVEEVFAVPATHVLTPAHYRVEGRRWQGQMRQYYTVPYGPYYIWGATARILRAICASAGAAPGGDDNGQWQAGQRTSPSRGAG